MRVVSTPAVRLRSQATDVVTVPAGRTASVDVAGGGHGRRHLPRGRRPAHRRRAHRWATPCRFTVRATGYGQVARIVVGGALVLLAIAVALRVARRIRAARAAESGSLDP